MFDVKHHWLLIFLKPPLDVIFNEVIMYISTDVHVVYQNNLGNRKDSYTIEDVYNTASNKGGVLKRNIIGFYNEHNGYKIKIPHYKYHDRKNMTNVRLRTKVVVSIDSIF